MPVARFQMPDGRIARFEVPEGTTPEQAQALMRQHLEASGNQPENAAPVDPTAGMSTGQRLAAGIGSGMDEGYKAVRNTINDMTMWLTENIPGARIVDEAGKALGLDPISVSAPKDRAEQMATLERNAPLRATTAGRVGNVVGTGAVVAPTALIPGANTYTGAAIVGAGTGAALSESGERAAGAGVGVAGGVAGKYIGDKLGTVIKTAAGRVRQAIGVGQNADDAARAALVKALRANEVDISQIPQEARAELLAEVKRALAAGGDLDQAALGRKADFALIGAKPTTGQITRDPQQYAFEQTLQGVQGAGRPLAENAAENNRVLIDTLNKSGAAQAPGERQAGQAVLSSAGQYAAGQKAKIGSLYDQAKAAGGREVALEPSTFANRAGDLLDADLKNAFLPGDIRGMVNDFASGKVPLTVSTAEQFKTVLATAQRGAQDGNVKRAIGLVRQALDETPATADTGTEAIALFNQARAANRKFAGRVETIPALKATIDGAEPDKVFQKYVVGAPVNDVRRLSGILKQTPEKMSAVKAQAVDYLKQKALSGATDEVGNFSQAGYNKALNQLGVDRLKALGFTDEELSTLKAVGRVSSYIQSAPAGAKVNRSNTASQGYNLLLGLLEKFRKVPFGGPAVADPGADIVGGMAARSATAAAVPVSARPSLFDLIGKSGPAAATVGLMDLLQ